MLFYNSIGEIEWMNTASLLLRKWKWNEIVPSSNVYVDMTGLVGWNASFCRRKDVIKRTLVLLSPTGDMSLKKCCNCAACSVLHHPSTPTNCVSEAQCCNSAGQQESPEPMRKQSSRQKLSGDLLTCLFCDFGPPQSASSHPWCQQG